MRVYMNVKSMNLSVWLSFFIGVKILKFWMLTNKNGFEKVVYHDRQRLVET